MVACNRHPARYSSVPALNCRHTGRCWLRCARRTQEQRCTYHLRLIDLDSLTSSTYRVAGDAPGNARHRQHHGDRLGNGVLTSFAGNSRSRFGSSSALAGDETILHDALLSTVSIWSQRRQDGTYDSAWWHPTRRELVRRNPGRVLASMSVPSKTRLTSTCSAEPSCPRQCN